jgi:hypothetical protein
LGRREVERWRIVVHVFRALSPPERPGLSSEIPAGGLHRTYRERELESVFSRLGRNGGGWVQHDEGPVDRLRNVPWFDVGDGDRIRRAVARYLEACRGKVAGIQVGPPQRHECVQVVEQSALEAGHHRRPDSVAVETAQDAHSSDAREALSSEAAQLRAAFSVGGAAAWRRMELRCATTGATLEGVEAQVGQIVKARRTPADSIRGQWRRVRTSRWLAARLPLGRDHLVQCGLATFAKTLGGPRKTSGDLRRLQAGLFGNLLGQLVESLTSMLEAVYVVGISWRGLR